MAVGATQPVTEMSTRGCNVVRTVRHVQITITKFTNSYENVTLRLLRRFNIV